MRKGKKETSMSIYTYAVNSKLFMPVFEIFKDEVKTFLWFGTPNPMLGGCKPIDMVLRGREEKLIQFIEGCRRQNAPDNSWPPDDML
jgi:uncharacterized protein (DUF2384 family)